LIDRIQQWVSEPPPDHLFEITESSLAAVSPRIPAQQKQEVLPERGAVASPAAHNLLKPQLYQDALQRLVPGGSAKRSAAALVIPDYAVRMAMVDFEQFPANEAERLALLRFRLRKTVPFPIDEAQLAYSVQLNEPKRIEVLAVAIARPILEEYETLLTSSGYRVGVVMPSSLAALPLCAGAQRGLTVLAKAAGATLTILLLEAGRVRLVRCLDLAVSEGEAMPRDEETVLPVLRQTLAYAEDQIGQPVTRLLLCGFGTDTDSIGALVQEELGISYSPLRSKYGAASQAKAGLLGLLEQYAL
jgi:type IV pilus assembly protein PilM